MQIHAPFIVTLSRQRSEEVRSFFVHGMAFSTGCIFTIKPHSNEYIYDDCHDYA